MDHLEAIVEIKNVISPEFINKIIPLTKHKAKKNLEVFWGFDKNVRNVKGHHLNFLTPTNLFYFNFIKKEIERIYGFYKAKFPKMHSIQINQIDLLKYNVGGKYTVHTDHFTDTPRHLSIIMNLNDDYEGGDLIFTDQKNKEIKRLKLGKGTIVFFPSNFMYPHSIQPITKGTRYSIVSWLR
jgi:predicted 2-oxoglutarate/Fe(II)-dependent dioxygenase YbiX